MKEDIVESEANHMGFVFVARDIVLTFLRNHKCAIEAGLKGGVGAAALSWTQIC